MSRCLVEAIAGARGFGGALFVVGVASVEVDGDDDVAAPWI